MRKSFILAFVLVGMGGFATVEFRPRTLLPPSRSAGI